MLENEEKTDNFSYCFLILSFVLGSLVYFYTPHKYDIYLNGQLMDASFAYEYNGHMYIPVLGTMKMCGYDVMEQNGTQTIAIDDVQYRLSLEDQRLYAGEKSFLGVMSGKCFLSMEDNELHILVGDLDHFFDQIGKDSLNIRTDRIKKCVYLEIDKTHG